MEKETFHLRFEIKIDWWIEGGFEIDNASGWLEFREEISYGKEKGIVQ